MNRKEIVVLSLITFLTVTAWISFGVYYAKTSSTLSKSQLVKITPLTPTFDDDIIKKLNDREE